MLKRKLASLPNVAVITGAQTTEIMGDGERVTGLSYKDRRDGDDADPRARRACSCRSASCPTRIGSKGVVKLSARGEIEVNARGETSVPGVFAAGDCTVVPYKQIVIAMGEGAKASSERVRLPDPLALVGRGLRSTMPCRTSPSARDICSQPHRTSDYPPVW